MIDWALQPNGVDELTYVIHADNCPIKAPCYFLEQETQNVFTHSAQASVTVMIVFKKKLTHINSDTVASPNKHALQCICFSLFD